MGTRLRTYNELSKLKTFEERFDYLKLNGKVAESTFGFDRWMNQRFYKSSIWLKTRRDIIIRDLGNDLGVEGYEIHKGIIIHHMNPVTIEDIMYDIDYITNQDYLISSCLRTHNAIHYGDSNPNVLVDRIKGDTCPWKK